MTPDIHKTEPSVLPLSKHRFKYQGPQVSLLGESALLKNNTPKKKRAVNSGPLLLPFRSGAYTLVHLLGKVYYPGQLRIK